MLLHLQVSRHGEAVVTPIDHVQAYRGHSGVHTPWKDLGYTPDLQSTADHMVDVRAREGCEVSEQVLRVPDRASELYDSDDRGSTLAYISLYGDRHHDAVSADLIDVVTGQLGTLNECGSKVYLTLITLARERQIQHAC